MYLTLGVQVDNNFFHSKCSIPRRAKAAGGYYLACQLTERRQMQQTLGWLSAKPKPVPPCSPPLGTYSELGKAREKKKKELKPLPDGQFSDMLPRACKSGGDELNQRSQLEQF